jgi:uncharacterized protein (DUF1501 family)
MSMPATCRGPATRRDFLRIGTLALGGLGLNHLLAARGQASGKPAETSVILFWMWGGPSHLETYDCKPDAPSEYRGPFRPIPTEVPGLDICEIFPQQAQQAKRFSLVRSLHHTMSSHNDGSIEVLTGKTPQADPTSTALSQHPDFGMVANKLHGPRPDGMPGYIGIPNQPFMTRPAYLGVGYKGFSAGNPAAENYAPPSLALEGGIKPEQFFERRQLLGSFDKLRREIDQRGMLEGTDQLRGAAFQMLTNPQIAQAFAIDREEPQTRDRYGRTLWGQSCLLARRLAEAGAGVITIDALAPELGKPVYFSWDDHANPTNGWDLATGMKYRADHLDPALSALIEDIHERGLDQKILVVAMGEFGRTPRLTQGGTVQGRDHWPDAMCALVSGGGLKMGQVVGSTNRRGEYPQDRPLTPQDMLATIYRHLGIDYKHEFVDLTGRPIPILSSGEPIRELL